MERDFWLPNLSGEVFGRERLQACLEGYSSDDFELTLNENVVMMRSKPSSFLIPASSQFILKHYLNQDKDASISCGPSRS